MTMPRVTCIDGRLLTHMQNCFLSRHVHLCVTEDHVVLLDLRQDRYLALGDAESRALAARIPGWPIPGDSTARALAGSADGPKSDSLLRTLIAKRILTSDPELGRVPSSIEVARPAQVLVETVLAHTLLEDGVTVRPAAGIRELAKLVASCVVAASSLRWNSIEATVQRVRARRERYSGRSASLDLERARELVRAFVWLRPFVYSARDECLLDSLTLVEFLAWHDIFPLWIFGVRTGPFAAHCWIQYEDVVFNDSAEHARGYVPIMAV